MSSLVHVRVENFKSIQSALIPIKPGFTVISGPNGSGKSCLLESIAFALGASPAMLRVSVLKDLLRESRQDVRLLVELTFQITIANDSKKIKDKVIIGSSIMDNQRYYNINQSKVTKDIFSFYIKDKLKFSQEGWNIAQKAVQNIIHANPLSLFNSISYVSGTNFVFEAKNEAILQTEKAKISLKEIKISIDRLQHDMEEDKILMDKINNFDQLYKTKKQLSHNREMQLNQFKELTRAIHLNSAHECLINCETNLHQQQEVIELNNKITVLDNVIQNLEVILDELQSKKLQNNYLLDCHTSEHQYLLSQVITAVTEVNDKSNAASSSSITNIAATFNETETKLESKTPISISDTNDIESKIILLRNSLQHYEYEYESLTTNVLPNLVRDIQRLENKITTLNLEREETKTDLSSSDNNLIITDNASYDEKLALQILLQSKYEELIKCHTECKDYISYSDSLVQSVKSYEDINTEIIQQIKHYEIELVKNDNELISTQQKLIQSTMKYKPIVELHQIQANMTEKINDIISSINSAVTSTIEKNLNDNDNYSDKEYKVDHTANSSLSASKLIDIAQLEKQRSNISSYILAQLCQYEQELIQQINVANDDNHYITNQILRLPSYTHAINDIMNPAAYHNKCLTYFADLLQFKSIDNLSNTSSVSNNMNVKNKTMNNENKLSMAMETICKPFLSILICESKTEAISLLDVLHNNTNSNTTMKGNNGNYVRIWPLDQLPPCFNTRSVEYNRALLVCNHNHTKSKSNIDIDIDTKSKHKSVVNSNNIDPMSLVIIDSLSLQSRALCKAFCNYMITNDDTTASDIIQQLFYTNNNNNNNNNSGSGNECNRMSVMRSLQIITLSGHKHSYGHVHIPETTYKNDDIRSIQTKINYTQKNNFNKHSDNNNDDDKYSFISTMQKYDHNKKQLLKLNIQLANIQEILQLFHNINDNIQHYIELTDFQKKELLIKLNVFQTKLEENKNLLEKSRVIFENNKNNHQYTFTMLLEFYQEFTEIQKLMQKQVNNNSSNDNSNLAINPLIISEIEHILQQNNIHIPESTTTTTTTTTFLKSNQNNIIVTTLNNSTINNSILPTATSTSSSSTSLTIQNIELIQLQQRLQNLYTRKTFIETTQLSNLSEHIMSIKHELSELDTCLAIKKEHIENQFQIQNDFEIINTKIKNMESEQLLLDNKQEEIIKEIQKNKLLLKEYDNQFKTIITNTKSSNNNTNIKTIIKNTYTMQNNLLAKYHKCMQDANTPASSHLTVTVTDTVTFSDKTKHNHNHHAKKKTKLTDDNNNNNNDMEIASIDLNSVKNELSRLQELQKNIINNFHSYYTDFIDNDNNRKIDNTNNISRSNTRNNKQHETVTIPLSTHLDSLTEIDEQSIQTRLNIAKQQLTQVDQNIYIVEDKIESIYQYLIRFLQHSSNSLIQHDTSHNLTSTATSITNHSCTTNDHNTNKKTCKTSSLSLSLSNNNQAKSNNDINNNDDKTTFTIIDTDSQRNILIKNILNSIHSHTNLTTKNNRNKTADHPIEKSEIASVESSLKEFQEYFDCKQINVITLTERYDQTSKAISILEEGSAFVASSIEHIQNNIYKETRLKTKLFFSDLTLAQKKTDLIQLTDKLEEGLKFIVLSDEKNNNSSTRHITNNNHNIGTKLKSSSEQVTESDMTIHQLSGGQQSLLGMSFIFACALQRTCPVYLLDEIDSALDENNQSIISQIIVNIFKEQQV